MSVQILQEEPVSFKTDFISKAYAFIQESLLARSINFDSKSSKLLVCFVSADRMQNLNKKFRGKDKVTDVLSFSSEEKHALGELALCTSYISSQASEHGLTLEEEIVYLVLHGILHLLGYDHEKDKDQAKIMYDLQDSIFSDWIKQGR